MTIRHPSKFDDLHCWKFAQALAIECYRLARKFPAYEAYALGAQLRRAASSVPANIAEGFGRNTARDYTRSLCIARGSLFETESHLMLARGVGHLTPDDIAQALALREDAGRTLNALISSIRKRAIAPNRARVPTTNP